MRRWRVILVVAVAAAVVSYLAVFECIIIWDGGYELTVYVDNPPADLRAVRCETHSRREEAEETVEYDLPPVVKSWSAEANPYRGEPLTIRVATSGRETQLFRIELAYSQFRYLAVIATHADGRRTGRVVEIPDGRVARAVHVTLD